MTAPKKIWMMQNPMAWATRDDMFNTPYIRADLVDDLVKAFGEVLRISDRDHDAWIKAKAALARVKEEG